MTDIVQRLGSALADRYVIERELGAGGMATVYLAQDVRHDRKVALKVLRPELSAILGAERFLTEIKTTANLQHPHILSLFDSGEADGTVFYVMPYVEGESLRDRITREKQLPVDDAVRIAREVADALDYAHRHGVVHRDIKPENILLHDGRALVADFGIALAASRVEGGTRMTETGMSLGTPHYMAPEQAMGQREITATADVYALGCVLYEMLTGEPPFTGPTAQAIVARVMTEQPRSLTLQRHTVPPHVEAAVQKALEKLPADRFTSAAQLGEALAGLLPVVPMTRATSAVAAPRGGARRWQSLAPWAVAALGLALAAWGWLGRRQPADRVARHLVVLAESVAVRTQSNGSVLGISPNGTHIAFVSDSGTGRLWVRRLDDVHPQPLLGTDNGRWPTFSPDGEWIAYASNGRLFKVRADGGATITLADSVPGDFGGIAWLDDNTLVFTSTRQDLRRVSAAGGAVTVLTTAEQQAGGGFAAATPLPGSRGVLVQWCSSNCEAMTVQVLDLKAGRTSVLVQDAVRAWYLPTGHLLYVRRDGAALAAPFDLGSLRLTGSAVPVLENVQVLGSVTQLAVAENGTLLYATGSGAGGADLTVARVDRSGRMATIDSAWHGPFSSLAVSPDGRRVAVGSVAGTARDIWIKQLDRGPFTRLTFSGADRRPVYSPDGATVAYIHDVGIGSEVHARPADGNGDDRPLARVGRLIQAVAWSPDGQWLLLRTDNTDAGRGDILGVRVRGDSTPVPLVATPYEEMHPVVSPDSRWIAYTSDESGRQEVYVRPFPNTSDGRWLVSLGGGLEPVWSRDGRELFYVSATQQLMAARRAAGPGFAIASRAPLFAATPSMVFDQFHTSYAVTGDGRGFLLLANPGLAAAPGATAQLLLVEHWFTELRERVGRQ
jgi:serine/threonine-protein kinase